MQVSYCINALKDVPGRKYLIDFTGETDSLICRFYFSDQIIQQFDRENATTDAALRAGVVVHELSLAVFRLQGFPWEPEPLSKRTGGLYIQNSNFFVTKSGSAVSEELKDTT